MRFLVTRPAQDAAVLAQRLRECGHEAVIDPLLTVLPLGFSIPDEPITAIVVTSRQGARALGGHGDLARLKSVPVHCVGAASAEEARQAGFENVFDGGGDAASLAIEVGNSVARDAGVLLHVRGRHARGGLAERLALRGFRVREVIAYEARAADRLSAETRAALVAGGIDGVLLFSPRTAETFAALIAADDLLGAVTGRDAFCLSRAVAAVVSSLGMRIHVPSKPTLDALVDLVVADAAERSN